MNRLKIILSLALAAGMAVASGPASAQQLNLEQKKALAIQFYNALIQGDVATLHKVGREDYIQHNPNYETGLQGLEKMIQARAPRPAGSPPIAPLQFVRIIAEGDYVMLLRRMPPGANAPPGPDNERANVDIFRVQDGKIAEHWDYQEQFPRGTNPPKNPNGHF